MSLTLLNLSHVPVACKEGPLEPAAERFYPVRERSVITLEETPTDRKDGDPLEILAFNHDTRPQGFLADITLESGDRIETRHDLLPGASRLLTSHGPITLDVDGPAAAVRPTWQTLDGEPLTVALACGCDPQARIGTLTSCLDRQSASQPEENDNAWDFREHAHAQEHLGNREPQDRRSYPDLQTAMTAELRRYEEGVDAHLAKAGGDFGAAGRHHARYMRNRRDFLALAEAGRQQPASAA